MIHLNIGSNLNSKYGSRVDNIVLALNLLLETKIEIKKISNFYETPSYPNKQFPKFLNVGLIVNYRKSLFDFLKKIRLIEKKIGRIRAKKNDPRVIDIDIIDFNGKIKNSKNIRLPHPLSHARNFVLYPIKQIDPNWIHPVLKQNINYLIKKLDFKSRIEITRLSKNVNIRYD